MASRLKGWRFGVFFGTFVSAVCGTMYLSAIRPMMNLDYYKQVREEALPQLPKKDY